MRVDTCRNIHTSTYIYTYTRTERMAANMKGALIQLTAEVFLSTVERESS